MAKELMELLTGHYGELLETGLDEDQQARYIAYINGDAEYETVQDLPKADPYKTRYYGYVGDHLENGQKKQNIGAVLRFLDFIYKKGGWEAFNKFIASMLEYSYKGIRIQDFFGGGSPLTQQQQIEYFLYELDDQLYRDKIDKYLKRLGELADDSPDDFAAIVREGAPRNRFRAAVFLYGREPEQYGPVIERLVPEFDNYKDAEPLFNACGLTGFACASLCAALAAVWRKAPGHTVGRICWNKDYYPDFLDKSLFSKDYPYDENPPCEMDYLAKVAKAIGLEDIYLLEGLYWQFDDAKEVRYLADFLKAYPRELLEELYGRIITDKASANSYLAMERLLGLLGMSTAPLAQDLARNYDVLLRRELPRSRFFEGESDDADEEDPAKAQVAEQLARYFFEGDDALLQALYAEGRTGETITAVIDFLGGSLRSLSRLLGGYAQEEALAPRIHRYAVLMAYSHKLFDAIPFIEAAQGRYNWDGARILDYFSAPDVPVVRRLRLLDEVLHHIGEDLQKLLLPAAQRFVLAHEAETLAYLGEQLADYDETEDNGLLMAYYEGNPAADPTPLVEALKIKNKDLRALALRYIGSYPAARPLLEELQNAKRKDIRDHAEKALAALEKMNQFVLPGQAGQDAPVDPNFDIDAYAKKNLPKTAGKLLAFTAPEQWPRVRLRDKEEVASLDALRCYICLYLQSRDMERLYTAEKIRSCLRPADMKALVLTVFADWRAAGADTKTKGAMTLLGIHGEEEAVRLLRELVAEFVQYGRSAMAADAVRALGVSHSTIALVAVDNLSRLRGDKRVRRIAAETIAAAAESMGLTVDEMADKIVPTLGMDIRGESELSTGGSTKPGRAFRTALQADLKVKLLRADGKEIKAFPRMDPDVDDYEGYDRAKADFNLLKKELRNIVKVQTLRLELALASGRTWTPAGYRELFVDNPIMQRFASSLVFGIYRDGALQETFRYAGDGSFSDADDAVFTLPEEGEIRIAHPCELPEALAAKWRAQLADYEVAQPFPQLDRPVFDNSAVDTPTYRELHGEDFSIYSVQKLMNFGWQRDAGGDAGSYYCTWYEDAASGIGACITFTNALDIVSGAEENTTIEELVFFQLGTVRVGYKLYIETHDILPVKNVPQKVFSEVLYRIKQVLAKK